MRFLAWREMRSARRKWQLPTQNAGHRPSLRRTFDLMYNRMEQNRRGTPTRRIRHRDISAKIPQRMSCHGQSHSNSNRVLGADKWFEHLVANVRIESPPVVGDANLDELALIGLRNFSDRH